MGVYKGGLSLSAAKIYAILSFFAVQINAILSLSAV